MRKFIAASVLLAIPAVGFTAPPASAYCDPKYWPLCTNDCQQQPPDWNPKDPVRSLFRACPE